MKIRLVVAIALVLTGGFAQSDRGIITGTVADSTGAMIPATKVALNQQRNGRAL